MTSLVERRCKPCDGKVAAYTTEQALDLQAPAGVSNYYDTRIQVAQHGIVNVALERNGGTGVRKPEIMGL